MEVFKHKLLLGKNFEFNEADDNSFLGDLNSRNSSKTILKVCLNKFSKTKSGKCSESKIRDISWVLKYSFEKNDDKEYLTFGFEPICDNDELKYKLFGKRKVTLKIIQYETRKTNILKNKFQRKNEKVLSFASLITTEDRYTQYTKWIL